MPAPLYSKHGFADVTHDEDAVARADLVPELRAGFEALGFRPLGFLGDRPYEGRLWVHEVLTSPEQDAFVTLALSPPSIVQLEPRTLPTAILQTALENGSIVVTTNCPGQFRLLNHPRAGSYLEGWTHATPAELWERHRQRVDEIFIDQATSLLPHETMDLRLRIAERCTAVALFVGVCGLLSWAVAFVGLGALWFQVMRWLHELFGGAGLWGPIVFSIATLPIMAAFGWLAYNRMIISWAAGERLARLFPWPRRRPLDGMELHLCSKF